MDLKTVEEKIAQMDTDLAPLLGLEPPKGATLSFNDPVQAVLLSVCFRRILLEIQRQGALIREQLTSKS